ncbi:MAG: YvcK family protein [Candidatus Pacebacteria bacterium]|nr:YvcK family protein [Candidatus Paceibacterota bacterium]
MLNKKKYVCFGGGNAMPKAVLSELKNYPVEISVVCAMLDSGGSAGRLRRDYGISSPGDIRRSFIELSNTTPEIKKLLEFRFTGGELDGHNLFNILLAGLELSSKNYSKVLTEMHKLLDIPFEILPATTDKSNLCAILENGEVITGETNIDVPVHDPNLKIERVFLNPPAKAYSKTISAIKNADVILIGPGDLYSSLAQIFLVKGISTAIKKSKAKKIYICNLDNKLGETNDYFVEDFAKRIEELIDCSLDYVIYDKKGSVKINTDSSKFIGADVSNKKVHNSKKLIKTILKI